MLACLRVLHCAQVVVAVLGLEDYEFITATLHPQVPRPLLRQMLRFNDGVARQLGTGGGCGGSVGEFNLRDVLRWCDLISQPFARGGRED